MAKIPLEPIAIQLNDPVFDSILKWPFPEEEEFVYRILTEDIPQRVLYQYCDLWAYRDPEMNIVGFGTLSVSSDYIELTGNLHFYIPLLGVHPEKRGLGHGRTIVEHLVSE